MNWISISVTFLLLQAPSTLQAQQARPQDKASMQGFVVKMGTSEPISKAIATLTQIDGRRETYTFTTASGGQFFFQNLEAGQYRLSVSRNGYVRSEYGARSPNHPGLPMTLVAGQKMMDVLLPMMPAGTIAGRVFDRDGEPLANVNVQALKYSYQEGQRVLNTVQQTRTNDLGEYRLFWLPPGQYFVSATYAGGPGGGRGFVGTVAEAVTGRGGRNGGARAGGPAVTTAGRANTEAQPDEGYIPVYYPGTTEAQSAAPINLPAGIVFSGVDLTIVAVRTLRVWGQVINGVTGQPVRNANIFLMPRGQVGFGPGLFENFRNRNINEQGMFEIRGVVPGSYDLIGTLNDRNNRMSARVPLEIGDSDVQNVSLVISPGFSIPGRLVIEGRPASATNQDISRIRVSLGPRSGILQFAYNSPPATVQPDGTFSLQQVGQGEYRLNVTGMPRNSYVKMARLGAIDVLNAGLRVDRQPNGQLDILVGTDTGAADGTVLNEKQEPAANVAVVIVPDPAHRTRTDLYRTASTDALGHFHVEGIPPGDYKAFAWESVDSGAWQDSEFIRQYEDRGKPVRISENGQASIELRIIPAQM